MCWIGPVQEGTAEDHISHIHADLCTGSSWVSTNACLNHASYGEKWKWPSISMEICVTHYIFGLCRPVIDQNFYYAGLKFTSPTFSCAMSNMLPAMTFVMAVLFRYVYNHHHHHHHHGHNYSSIIFFCCCCFFFSSLYFIVSYWVCCMITVVN